MADVQELTEESTKEDIDSLVEHLFEEDTDSEESVEEPEQKSDAQITTEQADIEDTEDTAEKPPVADKGETDKAKSKDSDWRDEANVEASAYGFSKEDIAEFETREEFDRAMKLFDRKAQAEREKLDEDGDEKAEADKDGGDKKGRYEIKMSKDRFDDELVDELTQMRDHYEERITALESTLNEEKAFAAEEKFDRTVDELGFSQFFGKTGEESATEMSRRKDLYRRVKVEQKVLANLGQSEGDYDALVSRVARAAFPDEYDKKLIKNHTRKISRQSNGRQGGGATRATDPPEQPRDWADQLYKEMSES